MTWEDMTAFLTIVVTEVRGKKLKVLGVLAVAAVTICEVPRGESP